MIQRPTLVGPVLAGLGLLIGAVCGEAGLRLYASAISSSFARELVQRDPFAVLIEPHGELGYRQKRLGKYRYGNGTVATTNAMGFRGPEVANPRPAGTYRIVLSGGSSTHGWGVHDDETIDWYMREILRRRYPDRAFEVVNLAFDGYDAYQVFERLRSEWHWLNPDAVIVNTGVNDVRNARFPMLKDRDPRTLIWGAEVARLAEERRRGGPSSWTRIKHYSYLARLPGLIRARLARRPSPPSPGDGSETRPNLQAIDYFERNLWRIVDLLDPATALILATPPSLLHTKYRPTDVSARTYWLVDAATTQKVRDSLAARMQSVVERLRAQGIGGTYLKPTPPASMFLDDAHLTPDGNREMAMMFVDALSRHIAAERGGGSSVAAYPSLPAGDPRKSER